MLALAVRRLLQLPAILFAVYTATVLLLLAGPGDPLQATEKTTAQAYEAKLRRYSFDRPWYERYYWIYPRQLIVSGDLPSLAYSGWTVGEIISRSFPVSLQLGLFALVVALLGGCTIGVLAAVARGSPLDHLCLAVALVGVSLPVFVIAEVVLILFAAVWPVLPVGGWGSPRMLILPGVTLSLPFMAYIARLMRSSMLEVMSDDYIRTARAKGASRFAVIFEHAFKNSFLPVLSFLGPAAAGIFTGSFVVEKVFAIPGLGTHFVQSVLNGDQTLSLGIVLLYSTLLVVFNLIVDLAYAAVDPRIRVTRSERD
jgi:oligopeptide transport system permease protein